MGSGRDHKNQMRKLKFLETIMKFLETISKIRQTQESKGLQLIFIFHGYFNLVQILDILLEARFLGGLLVELGKQGSVKV